MITKKLTTKEQSKLSVVQPDEIDFKEIFIKLWKSKRLILFITIIFSLIPSLNHVTSATTYNANLNIELGKFEKPSIDCDVFELGSYKCKYNEKEYESLYSEKAINKLNSALNLKFNSNSNLNFISSIRQKHNSIHINAFSKNQDELKQLIPEVLKFINEKDELLINLVIIGREQYLMNLISQYNSLLNSFNLETAITDSIKSIERRVIENKYQIDDISLLKSLNLTLTERNTKGKMLQILINENKSLLLDEAYFKSFITDNNNQLNAMPMKLKETLFALFLGLFISILIALFKTREREPQ
ncbi:MAG: hypothetical protein HOK38_06390 [Flavobacteriaceae bacterium]|jgi:capsular polysaccharide biosynthesis protein|nr:hypothetical protein [Flavobacteriaceae bacterium]